MAKNDRNWKRKREANRQRININENTNSNSNQGGHYVDSNKKISNRAKGIIIVSTNVGSLGSDASSNSIIVRSQLHEKLANINNKFGTIDSLLIQECSNYGVKLLPFFNSPTTSNETASYGKDARGKRGVCSYSNDNTGAFTTDDDINELCVTVRSYTNAKGTKVKMGIVNIYRNQSVGFERSVAQTKIALLKIADKLKRAGIEKHIFIGDFNAVCFNLTGYREIRHDKLYHRANATTAKKRIDKVFTNLEHCGFLDILSSCENVHGPPQPGGQRQESDFGHKTIVLYAGAAVEKRPMVEETFPSVKKLNKILKGLKSVDLPEIDESVPVQNSKYTEWMARTLTEKCVDMLEEAKVTVKRKANNNNVVLINAIEQDSDDPAKRKVGEHWNSTFNFMARVKAGVGDGKEQLRPPLADNAAKLNKKLQNLNVMDKRFTIPATEKLFPVDLTNRGGRIFDKGHFRKLVLAVSNSGAPDYLKMSLKHTKAILGRNSGFRNFFQVIVERCLKGGYFPEVWKQDSISFLYKNKGDRLSTDFYRPITISPCLGKHLERCIMNYLSLMDDRNTDNNAYKTGRSTQTAIVNTQKALLEMKNPLVDEDSTEHEDLMLGSKRMKFITNINTEDIKAAFESIDHNLIYLAISRSFAGDKEYRVAELVRSYLKRKAFATERGSDVKIELIRRFENKTAPQGSILSPFLWRIYDSIFTKIYKDLLKVAVDKRTYDLFKFRHVSYADDHLTVFTIRVERGASKTEIANKIRGAMMTCRMMLSKATKMAGCGINPDKSENIITANWHEEIKKIDKDFDIKDNFKWLGYKLILTEEGELKFDLASITSKLITLATFRADVFQYTSSTNLRLKIYKTYLAPFIELYATIVIQGGKDFNSEVHKFQHSCLCSAIGASFTTNKIMVEEKCGEPPVLYKAIRMAKRLQFCCDTETAEKKALSESGTEITVRATRAGNTETLGGQRITQINKARKNFIFRINEFAKINDVSSNKKDEGINIQEIDKWVKVTNQSINNKILARTLSTQSKRPLDSQ